MIVFNNRERPNCYQIKEMGPEWLAEFLEMDTNYRYAGWTLDLMAYWLDQIVLNEFPRYCDEETLRMYERILRIEYNGEVSLDDRRNTVMAYWGGIGKFNKTAIQQIIRNSSGAEASVIWKGQTLYISYDNTDVKREVEKQIIKVIGRRIPAHIAWNVDGLYMAGAMENKEIWRPERIVFHTGLHFWPDAIYYDGLHRYDGSFKYDQERNYNLGLIIQNLIKVYQPKEEADAVSVFFNSKLNEDQTLVLKEEHHVETYFFTGGALYNSEKKYDSEIAYNQQRNYLLSVNDQHRMAVYASSEEIGTGEVITNSAHKYYYDSALTYDGSAKYSSIYRKEQLL